MKKPDFLHVDTDLWKLELIKKYWGGHGQKWVGHTVLRTLKLAACQGEMNGINWFLVC